MAVAVGYLLRLPLSYLLEGRWPGQPGRLNLVRYDLVGAVLGCVVLLLLIGWPSPGWAAFTAVVGAVSGVAGIWLACVRPVRWVVPVGALTAVLTAWVITLT